MQIELVACDLDGTLVGADLAFSPRLRRAVRCAQMRGLRVAIATGRAFPSARGFAVDLGLDAPLVCCQGAQIRTLEGAVLYEETLSRTYLQPVIEFCRHDGWELAIYHGDRIYQTTRLYDAAYYQRWFGLPIYQVDDLLAALPSDPCKFVIPAPDPNLADRLEDQLRALAGERFQVVRSHPCFVEGMGADVSKGAGLRVLARHMGVPRERVMAIGDNDNDADMVAWAGLGVAVGNATRRVKAAAGVIAPPQDMDGAAWAIETYVLGGQDELSTAGL